MKQLQASTSYSRRTFARNCLLCAGGLAMGFSTRQRTDRHIKEALFYEKTAHGLQCRKCPHECVLEEGETGICRNRVNRGGVMYSTAYGNPCAVHIDPIEKKPFFHFLPGTRAYSIAAAGCNLRCLNCQNWQISQVTPAETLNDDLMPDAVVTECIAERCESIAYTYSEPTTFYEYTLDTSAIARERKIKNLLKSSGYINDAPLRKLSRTLDAANIDLKAYDDDIYRRLSGARLAPVLHTLKVLKEEGVWLEITNLVIPRWTDDMDLIRRMCDWLASNGFTETPLHFSRFIPLYKLTQLPLTPVAVLERAHEIARKAGLQYVYIGNVPDHAAESTFCPSCKKVVIERRGFSIRSRHITDGRCDHCKQTIAGVWGT